MEITKRTATIVLTTTAIALIGDLIMYSMSAPPKGKFSLVLPKGKDLAIFLAIGITAGIAVDQVVKVAEKTVKSDEELALDDLVELEKEKSIKGDISEDLEPTDVVWIKA
jgi:hypothetical protein